MITWTTNQPATSKARFGRTRPTSTAKGANNATAHSVTLSNLAPSTSYVYKVQSTTAAGVVVSSGVYSFTTTP